MTGAAGKLGQASCRALQARGWRVRALHHRRKPDVYDELAEGSLEDVETLEAAAQGVDAVLHLAAVTHSRSRARYELINATGTLNLTRAVRRAGNARIVLVSTRSISAKGGAYSQSKVEAEHAVSRSGLPYTIVRLPEVYGTGGAEGVDRVIALARAGHRIPLVAADTVEVCPTHVDDAVSALVRALDSSDAEGKTYTLAGECMTLRTFAQECVATFGSASSIVVVPTSAARLLATLSRVIPLPLYPDQVARLLAPKPEPSPAAAQDLEFAPRPLRSGLAELSGSESR